MPFGTRKSPFRVSETGWKVYRKLYRLAVQPFFCLTDDGMSISLPSSLLTTPVTRRFSVLPLQKNLPCSIFSVSR